MSVILALVTITVLILTALSIWSTYRVKALLHPGLYFCILWAFGVASYLSLSLVQNHLNIYNADHVNELNGYVLFTAVLFYVFKGLGRKKVLKQPSIWQVHSFYPLFKYIAITALISAVSMFIIRAATLDFAATRDATVEFETTLYYGERSQTLLFTILGIFLSSNLILGVYAGFFIGDQFKQRNILRASWFILLLPLLTQIVLMLMVGGRIDFINILRAYVFGVSISIANGVSKTFTRKMIVTLVSAFLLFSIYSNINYQQRTTQSTNQGGNPILNQFSSIMEYYSAVYNGYQLRRYDFVTKELEYGEKTFAGILFFRIPFAGTLGLRNTSIGEIAGLEEYSMKKMFLELQSRNALHFSTVSSIYLLFYDDFGFWGTFLFLFFLVWITQIVYIKWFNSIHKSLFSIFFLFLFFVLWSNSIMDPVFATGFFRSTLFSIATLQVFYFLKIKFFSKPRQQYKIQLNK